MSSDWSGWMRPCHSFRCREVVLGIGHLVVYCFANVHIFALSASYAIDDIGRGAREVIGNLNGTPGLDVFST